MIWPEDFVDRIVLGDTLETLRVIPSAAIDAAVTSPPFWKCRDFGIEAQMGQEKTFGEYLKSLFSVCDELWRVLRPEGSFWIEIGDQYGGSGKGHGDKKRDPKFREGGRERSIEPARDGYPRKSLYLLPFRFALGMIERGWLCRNVVIWQKPNVIPESAKDRLTVDFSYVFFFVKSRRYYYDRLLDPVQPESIRRAGRGVSMRHKYRDGAPGVRRHTMHQPRENVRREGRGIVASRFVQPEMRNRRAVWSIPTRAFAGPHFATFPEELVEPMIRAPCPPGGLVLDPFVGTGTVAAVARKTGRHFVGIDLNPEYCEMAERRIAEILPLEFSTEKILRDDALDYAGAAAKKIDKEFTNDLNGEEKR
jgi:DNA modification methylase